MQIYHWEYQMAPSFSWLPWFNKHKNEYGFYDIFFGWGYFQGRVVIK